MVVVGVAVMDMGQIGAEPMVGDGVAFGAGLSSGSAIASPLQQNGPPREPVSPSVNGTPHHFWVPYQSSTSLRTWSLAMP